MHAIASGTNRRARLRHAVVASTLVLLASPVLSTRASAQVKELDASVCSFISCDESDSAITGRHWHSESVTYRLNTSIPQAHKDAIDEAATSWNDVSTDLRFSKGANTTSTDPAPDSTHIVWNGGIPSAWQQGCPPASSLACTNAQYTTNSHLVDADTVFNTARFTFGTDTANCAFKFVTGANDVQEIAAHEFGHWAHLAHSTHPGSVMRPGHADCMRKPSVYDGWLLFRTYPH